MTWRYFHSESGLISRCSLKSLRRIVLVLCFIVVQPACSGGKTTLTIIHFNDVYHIQPIADGKKGGAARVATLIKQHETENPLILFSGDAFGSSYMSVYLKGRQMVDVFGRLGLDYAVLGNHEFDFGPGVAGERVKQSKFTWLITNLVNKKTGKPVAGAEKTALVEWDGVKVGLVGLAGNWINSTSVGPDVAYLDFVGEAKKWAKELKNKGAQVVIALTHMNMRDDKILAQEVPDIDLVLGGHDHIPLQARIGDTLIWKTGSDWVNIGLIHIVLNKGDVVDVKAELLPITENIPEDPAVAKVVAEYVRIFESESGEQTKEVLGKTTVPLDVRRQVVRLVESNFGNFAADAIRAYAGSDVAILNGGGFRSDTIHPSGEITVKDIMAILPFSNHVVSLQMMGKQLRQVLEHGVSGVEGGEGRFPQVSGIQFTYNPQAQAGQRVRAVHIRGQPLEEAKVYVVAVNHYMADGGDDYTMLKALPRVIDEESGKLLAQVVAEAVQEKGVISPRVEGRIKKVGE